LENKLKNASDNMIFMHKKLKK